MLTRNWKVVPGVSVKFTNEGNEEIAMKLVKARARHYGLREEDYIRDEGLRLAIIEETLECFRGGADDE